MRGTSGAVCEIRLPPAGMRGARLNWSSWSVMSVRFAQLEPIRVAKFTFDPVGVELAPGFHHVILMDVDGHIAHSCVFEVKRKMVTLVTIFAPSTFLLPSKYVRKHTTFEVSLVDQHGNLTSQPSAS